jgi:hypothetical protein
MFPVKYRFPPGGAALLGSFRLWVAVRELFYRNEAAKYKVKPSSFWSVGSITALKHRFKSKLPGPIMAEYL